MAATHCSHRVERRSSSNHNTSDSAFICCTIADMWQYNLSALHHSNVLNFDTDTHT